jgi:hypothetical protein
MTKPLLLTCCLALGLLQSCSQANGSSYTAAPERPKTAEELRAELLVQEQRAPEEYLKVEGTYRRNLLDHLVLEGDIANTATLAHFKDPILSVTWYSKTGTELDTKQYAVYELVRAGRSTHYKLKTLAPDYVASVALGIADATAVE